MLSLHPFARGLISHAPCHLQRHDQAANDVSRFRNTIPARHVDPSREVVEFSVCKGFSPGDQGPAGYVHRRGRNGRRVHGYTHFWSYCSPVHSTVAADCFRPLYHEIVPRFSRARDSVTLALLSTFYPQAAFVRALNAFASSGLAVRG